MSFSGEVKEEISKLNNLANKEAVKYELLGYIITNNISAEKNKIKFCTESEYSINRYSKLLNNLQYSNHKIEIIGKKFCISVNKPDISEITYMNNTVRLEGIINKVSNQEILEKAFVRGSFLGGGSVNNPKNNYHLEIIFSSEENASIILEILSKYEINFKKIEKKNGQAIYTKDGEQISKFLALIGASTAVLKFEEIRVYREIRNNVNRKVNCETANLNKIIDASIKQVNAIKKLKKEKKFENLPENLKELANLRVQNPEASYQELGGMLKEPIGKSGVSHRLEKIIKIAEE